jgi:hypothetical protein
MRNRQPTGAFQRTALGILERITTDDRWRFGIEICRFGHVENLQDSFGNLSPLRQSFLWDKICRSSKPDISAKISGECLSQLLRFDLPMPFVVELK